MATETLQQIWLGDQLGRKEEALFIQQFLEGRYRKRVETGLTSSFVLELDARWGAGKTFFMTRFARQLRLYGYVVAEINAWRDDIQDDAFISVMAAIDKELGPYIGEPETVAGQVWKAVKEDGFGLLTRLGATVLKRQAERYIGTEMSRILGNDDNGGMEGPSVNDVSESPKLGRDVTDQLAKLIDERAERAIADFRKSTEAIADFGNRLSNALEKLKRDAEVPLPLFVLIDELDRCRPAYALSLLERVKHLFETNHIVFVFATNAEQLGHSVAGAYGSGFDGRYYLKRFFERTYRLDTSNDAAVAATALREINFDKFAGPPAHSPEELIVYFIKNSKLAPRDIERFGLILESVVDTWPHKEKIDLFRLLPEALAHLLGVAPIYGAAGSLPDFHISTVRGFSDRDNIYISSAYESAIRYATDFDALSNLGSVSGGITPIQKYFRDTYFYERGRRKDGATSVQSTISVLVKGAIKIAT